MEFALLVEFSIIFFLNEGFPQGIEQVHQFYERAWDRFRCNDTENPSFKGRQLSSLLTYNYDQMYRLVTKNKKKREE